MRIKINYEVYLLLALHRQNPITTIAVMNTGTGRNFLRYETVPARKSGHIVREVYLRLRGANGTVLARQGTLRLLVALGNLSVPVEFSLVVCLAT